MNSCYHRQQNGLSRTLRYHYRTIIAILAVYYVFMIFITTLYIIEFRVMNQITCALLERNKLGI